MRPSSILVLVLAFAAAGCALDEMRLEHVPSGSPSWRGGYADGCQSGRRVQGGQRHRDLDPARYRADDDYRAGWDEGYRQCHAARFDAEAEGGEAPAPAPEVSAAAAAEPARPVDEPRLADPPPAAALPVPAPPPPAAQLAEPLQPPAAELAAPSSAARRQAIESRIDRLRAEIRALEAELQQLPPD